MTISEELNKLINSKEAIRQSIIAKGTDVGTDVPFSDYASKIDEIQTGDGPTYVNPNFYELRTNGGADCSYLFYRYPATSINLSKLDTSNVTNMRNMFSGLTELTSVGDISKWDTSNVADMQYMFYECKKLNSLDLSGWDTSNVTDMQYMFYGCNNLYSLNGLTNWDTSNVTNMNRMFASCTKLNSLDLSGWNTGKVTDMQYMFYGCNNLYSLNGLTNWDTSNVTNMNHMFATMISTFDPSELISLDLSGWDTSNVTTMSGMFYNFRGLASLDLSGWDTSNVTTMINSSMSIMFLNNNYLKNIKGSIDCSSVNGLTYNSALWMFNYCSMLEELYLKNIYKNVTMKNDIKYSINLGKTVVKDECLISIINELPDLINDKGLTATDKIVLTLPPTNTLTAEQVQVAINKGWNVANTTY